MTKMLKTILLIFIVVVIDTMNTKKIAYAQVETTLTLSPQEEARNIINEFEKDPYTLESNLKDYINTNDRLLDIKEARYVKFDIPTDSELGRIVYGHTNRIQEILDNLRKYATNKGIFV